jgi:hypothetical protein
MKPDIKFNKLSKVKILATTKGSAKKLEMNNLTKKLIQLVSNKSKIPEGSSHCKITPRPRRT